MGAQPFLPVLIGCATVVGALAAGASGTPRAAQGRRFAVINLSGAAAPANLLTEIEREIQRLVPGATPIQEPSMRVLLAGATAPADAAAPWAEVAADAALRGDCDVAIDKARAAEELALSSLATRDARRVLEISYRAQVLCADAVHDRTLRATAFRRLRALTHERPNEIDATLWDTLLAETPDTSTKNAELFIDSEPPNAQIFVDFHNVGTTPTTLRVARGEVLIEIEKEGYKKAFRRLDVDTPEQRTVFRLVERQRDRSEMVAAALKVLGPAEPTQRLHTLAQVAQWVRADLLVLVRVNAEPMSRRVNIWQFDAERGALAKDVISSAFDPESGRVEALAARPTRAAGQRGGILSPTGSAGPSSVPGQHAEEGDAPLGLDGRFEEPAALRGPPKTKPPWWGYLIAVGVIAFFTALVISDQPRPATTLDVKATWEGYRSP